MIKQFQLRAISYGAWLLNAGRLERAADILFDAVQKDRKAIEENVPAIQLSNLELSLCASMLYGFALENLLKPLYFKNHQNGIKNGALKLPKKSHDLKILAMKVGFKINNVEADLLDRLTQFVIWAGRYPVPRFHGDMALKQARISSGKFVPLPLEATDLATYKQLYKKFASRIRS